jgi:hypothetical protein
MREEISNPQLLNRVCNDPHLACGSFSASSLSVFKLMNCNVGPLLSLATLIFANSFAVRLPELIFRPTFNFPSRAPVSCSASSLVIPPRTELPRTNVVVAPAVRYDLPLAIASGNQQVHAKQVKNNLIRRIAGLGSEGLVSNVGG